MAEHKYFLTGFTRGSAVVIDTVPQCLTLVPQNTTQNGRIGDKCIGTSLEVQFWTCLPGNPLAGFIPGTTYRFVGFIWKQDTIPTIPDIVDLNYNTAGSVLKPLQPFNHAKKISRKILWDKRWCTFKDDDAAGTSWLTTWEASKCGKFVINLTKLKNNLNKINFDPGVVTGRNLIYFMLLYSGMGAAPPQDCQFYMQTKYTYTDE